MYRIKLMILWGMLFSIWLCKSLFTGSCADESKDAVCARAVFAEYTEESTETGVSAQKAEKTELTAENNTSEMQNIKLVLPYDIESYVIGVVAAEMPVYFPEEALKAQAVAARTYACHEYMQNGITDPYSIGQAHLTQSELQKRWGGDFEENYSKISSAVAATEGEILIYEEKPILAAFCSASGGITESSANAWGSSLPYLQSVKSPYDTQAPVYMQEKQINSKKLAELLGVSSANDIHITRRSEAGYVLSLEAGGKRFSGDDIRRILGLRSSDFEIMQENGEAVFTAYGYGHGVGMSQYGACYMAQNGSGCKEILLHYYTGAELRKIS